MIVLVSQVWLPVAGLFIVMGTAAWHYLRKDLADKAAYGPLADLVTVEHPTLASKRLPGSDCTRCRRVAAEPDSAWCGPCEEELFPQGARPLCLRCDRFPQQADRCWCPGCARDVDLFDAADVRTLEEK